MFRIVLDVYRDNRVYPLQPGFTAERVLAELDFYGLQDFEGPMELSFISKLQSLQELTADFSKWQEEQERIGQTMLAEAFARILVARAARGTGNAIFTTLTIPSVDISATPYVAGNIEKLFEQWNVKATSRNNVNSYVQGAATVKVSAKFSPGQTITLEPAEPKAGA